MNPDPDLLLSHIDLNLRSDLPLYRRLYEALRDLILEGRLAAGQKLPATRTIADHLNVSRTTVLIAFENLLAEGYILGQQGSGTYVSPSIPEEFFTVPADPGTRSEPYPVRPPSQRGQRLGESVYPGRRNMKNLAPFRPGIPSLRDFPIETWARLAGRQLRSLPFEQLGYGDPAGYAPLRKILAAYLRETRAVRCESEQVIIVNGSQQGLSLAANVLLDTGDSVWIEDPGYLGAREAFSGAGLRLLPTPVDAEGLVVNPVAEAPALIYVTPSHQFPTGVTMSLTRRLHLLEYARQRNCWILEDDYDSEYRFAGKPLSSLQGLDPGSPVIYMGTLSKVLFPGIRLGYLIVPEDLIDTFVAARAKMDRNSPILEQATLAQFMDEGFFARHIRKMRLLYADRQQCLLEQAHRQLGDVIKIEPNDAGLHIVGRLEGITEDALADSLVGTELILPTLASYTQYHFQEPGVVMGYAAFAPKEIERAVRKLGESIRGIRTNMYPPSSNKLRKN